MKNLPSYTKILTLGSSRTENALIGDVIIQEKIDGSQFKFGINEDNELLICSKGCKLEPIIENGELLNIQKLFIPAVKYILSIKEDLLSMPKNTYYYAETLFKSKHNVLSYETVPTNHIVLFDVMCDGEWLPRKGLEKISKNLGIDLIPELYTGKVDINKIKELLTTQSYLGKELIEGVVIKNYNQNITLGANIFPLFTKYVRESFKERHDSEWKTKKPKDNLQNYINGFNSEARWQKAIIHLKEKELLENSPKDIGKLILEVQKDIKEEEKENIKDYLYKFIVKDILRKSTQGLPEYYKEQLLNNLNEQKIDDIIPEEGYCRLDNENI